MPLTALTAAVGSGTNRWQVTANTSSATGIAVLLAGCGVNNSNIVSSRGNVATFRGRVQVSGSTRAALYWCPTPSNPGAGDVWADPDGGISSAEIHVIAFSGGTGWDVSGSLVTGDDATQAGTTTLGGGGQNALPALTALAGDAIVTGVVWTSAMPGSLTAGPSGAAIASSPSGSLFAGATALHNVAAGGSVQASVSWANSGRWGAIAMLLRAASGAPAPVITGPSGSTGAATSTASIAENASTGPAFSISGTMASPYPRLSGVDAARFSLTNVGGGVYRADPVPPLDFEAPSDSGANRIFDIVLEASASVSQACAITLTNVNEGPVWSGPAIGDLTFVVGQAITAVPIAARFIDPEGLTVTGSILESLPPGLSVVGGQLVGTPTAASPLTTYTPRGADPAGNATNGSTFSITVTTTALSYSVTLPAVVRDSSTVRVGESFRWVGRKVTAIEDIASALPVQGVGSTHATTGVRTLTGFPSPGTWLVDMYYPATGALSSLTGLTSRLVTIPA